jgi:hypothetical protein
MEILSAGFITKFSGLLFFLKRSNKEFEMVADEMGNRSLRTALNGLSEESGYYAGELKNYLGSLGFAPATVTDEETEIYSYEPPAESPAAGYELLNICAHNEDTLVQAYNELMSECPPHQSLKEIMLCQLNALRYTFMKIKMLNTARFAAY